MAKEIDNVFLKVTEGIVQGLNEATEFTPDALTKCRLALSTSLLSMSVELIPKANKLMGLMDKLEDKIFSDEVLRSLSPSDALVMYQMIVQRQAQMIQFNKDVLSSTKWKELEGLGVMIKSMMATDKKNPEAEKLGNQLLETLNKLQGSQKVDNFEEAVLISEVNGEHKNG